MGYKLQINWKGMKKAWLPTNSIKISHCFFKSIWGWNKRLQIIWKDLEKGWVANKYCKTF